MKYVVSGFSRTVSMRYVVSGFSRTVSMRYVVSGFSRTLACLLLLFTASVDAQRGRGAGELRPNMLDDSDVTLQPPFSNSIELVPNPNAPQGRIHRFTMKSEDSKIYKGISRDKPGAVVPYERSVAIYIPAQYVA